MRLNAQAVFDSPRGVKRPFVTAVIGSFLLFSGCGYFLAGEWEDDPDNWRRAFQSEQPPDVSVVHSWYWRSPHWSDEFQYFFEVVLTAELEEQLFTENRLRQLVGEEAAAAKGRYFVQPPAWFAPKSVSEYEVWVFADEPRRNFTVFIDKASGNLFLTDYQV